MPDLFEQAEAEARAEERVLTVQRNDYERARFVGEPVPPAYRVESGGAVHPYGADVTAFHEKFGLAYVGPIRHLPDDLFDFRFKFLLEEALEFSRTDDPAEEFDALIDLAYVATGTVYLHGVDVDVELQRSFVPHFGRIQPKRRRPRESMKNAEVLRIFTQLSRYLRIKHEDFDRALDSLTYIIAYCQQCAAHRGLDFNEGWRRVQAANMAKVRAERPADSKRGSGFDVIKPPGWTAPDHSDLVADMEQES